MWWLFLCVRALIISLCIMNYCITVGPVAGTSGSEAGTIGPVAGAILNGLWLRQVVL